MISDNFSLQDAASVWGMLDDLAQKDPKAYKQFIEKTLSDGEKQGFCVPKPFQCIETEKLPPLIPRKKFYINIATWDQVAIGNKGSDVQKFIVGEVRSDNFEDSSILAVDVLGHSKGISNLLSCSQTGFYRDVIHLVETQKTVKLSGEYKVKDGYIGNKDYLYNFMCPKKVVQNAEETLADTISLKDVTKFSNSIGNGPEVFKKQNDCTSNSNSLLTAIEEKNQKHIANRQMNSSSTRVPKHSLEVTSLNTGNKRKMKLEIEMPGVKSVASCQVELLEDSILVQGDDIYMADIPLPCKVNEEQVQAIFIKKECKLIVTMVSV